MMLDSVCEAIIIIWKKERQNFNEILLNGIEQRALKFVVAFEISIFRCYFLVGYKITKHFDSFTYELP